MTKDHGYRYYFNGALKTKPFYTKAEAETAANEAMASDKTAYYNSLIRDGMEEALARVEANAAYSSAVQTKYIYKRGGLIDFTGPAWVDGTPMQPESILNAYDTKAIMALTDALNYIYIGPGITPGSDVGMSNNTNVGDITIVINQAELKEDADYDEVARKIGQAFTKEMSKNGLNLAGYAF